MPTRRTVSREELYALVWKIPMRKLSADFGVSDVAIAKACKRLNVPRPPRGYWMKLEAGKRVRNPSLPAAAPGEPVSAEIGATEAVKLRPRPVPCAGILVGANLRNCHPDVAATKSALEGARVDSYGKLYVHYGSKTLNVKVTKGALDRAMRLLSALLFACEREGWRVVAGTQRHGSCYPATTIEVGEAQIVIGLALSEIVVRGTETEGRWPTCRYEPTGLLRIEITNRWGLKIRKWSDGKSQRLEDILGEIVSAISEAADRLREERVLQAEQQRAYAERERQHEEAEAVLKAEFEQRAQRERRIKELRTELEWQAKGQDTAAQIRGLVDAMRVRFETAEEGKQTSIERWCAWAEKVAQEYDPLRNGYVERVLNMDDLP